MTSKGLNLKNSLKATASWHPSKSCLFWGSSGLIEWWMEWRDLLSMRTRTTSSCSLQRWTTKRFSRHPTKNPQSFSSFPLAQTHFQMSKNLPKTKVFRETSSSISRWDRAWKRRLTFTSQLPQTEDIGWCCRTVTCSQPGSKITSKNSFKPWPNPTKTLDSGLQLNQLTLSHWVFCKSHWRWSHSLQMD